MDGIDDRFARRLSGWARSLPPASIIAISPSILADQLRPTEPELIASDGLLRAQKAWASALELWQDEDDAFEFLIRKQQCWRIGGQSLQLWIAMRDCDLFGVLSEG